MTTIAPILGLVSGTVRICGLICLLIAAALTSAHAQNAQGRTVLNKLSGTWCGPGEIVAGKYKDTKFTCALSLSKLDRSSEVTMSGNCRVGVFAQEMNGTISFKGRSVKGTFLGGAVREGLDITSGRFSSNRLTVNITRPKIKGEVKMQLKSQNRLSNTVAVRVGDDLVPVINMNLKACNR